MLTFIRILALSRRVRSVKRKYASANSHYAPPDLLSTRDLRHNLRVQAFRMEAFLAEWLIVDQIELLETRNDTKRINLAGRFDTIN